MCRAKRHPIRVPHPSTAFNFAFDFVFGFVFGFDAHCVRGGGYKGKSCPAIAIDTRYIGKRQLLAKSNIFLPSAHNKTTPGK